MIAEWPYITRRPDPVATAERMHPATLLQNAAWRLAFHREGRGDPALRFLWREQVRYILQRALSAGESPESIRQKIGVGVAY